MIVVILAGLPDRPNNRGITPGTRVPLVTVLSATAGENIIAPLANERVRQVGQQLAGPAMVR